MQLGENVLGNLRQSNIFVGNLVDLAGCANLSLDADTVDRLGHLGIGEGDGVDSVIVTTTNRANG